MVAYFLFTCSDTCRRMYISFSHNVQRQRVPLKDAWARIEAHGREREL